MFELRRSKYMIPMNTIINVVKYNKMFSIKYLFLMVGAYLVM